MDHSPLRYLDKAPAEAAEFLARTAAASRMVGGYVKTARLEKDATGIREVWDNLGQSMGTGGRDTLAASALGAGVGGLGGAALGAMGRRRRPVRAGLTGALMGGLMGGAGYGLYQLAQTPSVLDKMKKDEDIRQDHAAADEIRAKPPHQKVIDAVGRKIGDVTGFRDAPEAGTEAAQAEAEQGIGKNLVETGKEVGGIVKDVGQSAGSAVKAHAESDPTPYAAGTGAAGAYLATRPLADRAANFRAGAKTIGAASASGGSVPAGLAETRNLVGSRASIIPGRNAWQGLRASAAMRGNSTLAQNLQNIEARGAEALAGKGGRGLLGRLGKGGLIGLGTGLATEFGPAAIESKTGIGLPSPERYIQTGQAFRPGQNWFTGE